jgi:predicted RNA-binding protein YlqC (UPF0109 family)
MTEATAPPASDEFSQDMLSLVKEIATALVDHPESVVVDAIADRDGTLLRLRVAPADVGKVIGKQGRTARSMRTILSAASMKLKHRYSLDIVEEDDKQPAP